MELLAFARGPGLWLSLAVFFLGSLWRLWAIVRRPAKPDYTEARSAAVAAGAVRAIVTRMWHHRTFRERTLVQTLNAYGYHIGLAIVFFGFVPHIGFLHGLTGLSWPAVPGCVFVAGVALVFVGLVYVFFARLTSPVQRLLSNSTGAELPVTSCSNCRQTFDDARAHFEWDQQMTSLLELVADHLADRPAGQ